MLPEPFAGWFARRGWRPRAHQLELLAKAQAGKSSAGASGSGSAGGKSSSGASSEKKSSKY